MGCPAFAFIGKSLVFTVATKNSSGVLTDASSGPTYRIYEDETGTAILTGTMAKLDDANTTGFYSESIDVTAANGFEDSKTYSVYVEYDIGANTHGESLSFTAYNLLLTDASISSSGISTIAENVTVTTGTETNTYTSTGALDGTYHSVADVGNTTDFYYQFDIGVDGVPIQIEWEGYASANNDSYLVYFYNWITAGWDQVGIIAGKNNTVLENLIFSATVQHVGSGSNAGKVRFRFYSTNGNEVFTDRILCTYAQLSQGIPNGTTITLGAATENDNLIGHGWSLALNGQSISGSYFYQSVNVSGTGIAANGNGFIFQQCSMSTVSLSCAGFIDKCAILDVITLTSTAGVTSDDILLSDCISFVPGSGSPHIDASGVTKTTRINVRRWSGGLELTLTADCTVSVDVISGGTITINGTGGVVNIRGIVENVVDNTSGAATITQTAALNRSMIAGALNNISVSDVLNGVVEGSVTLKQSIQLANAALAGKLSGAGGLSVAIRDLADSKDRISATVDSNGNRSAITTDFD